MNRNQSYSYFPNGISDELSIQIDSNLRIADKLSIQIGVKILEVLAVDGEIRGSRDGDFVQLLQVDGLLGVHALLQLVVRQIGIDVSDR